ncbi:MAG TPA: hypothetical protein VKH37_08090 [Ferruginibacter sp.]|nr:hypothetical protein [Ferruginibacter sp.]
MKKKYLIVVVLISTAMFSKAQQISADGKSNSKQSGTMINGQPYDQYKAQQGSKSTITQQTTSATAKQSSSAPDNNIAGKTVTKTAVSADGKLPPVSNQGGITPVLIYTEPKAQPVVNQSSVVTAKAIPAATMAPSPKTQMIQPTTLKSSEITPTPVGLKNDANIVLNNNAGSGTSATATGVTLTSSAASAEKVATPEMKMPELTKGEPKPQEVVAVPPSTEAKPVKKN